MGRQGMGSHCLKRICCGLRRAVYRSGSPLLTARICPGNWPKTQAPEVANIDDGLAGKEQTGLALPNAGLAACHPGFDLCRTTVGSTDKLVFM